MLVGIILAMAIWAFCVFFFIFMSEMHKNGSEEPVSMRVTWEGINWMIFLMFIGSMIGSKFQFQFIITG